MDYPSYLSDSQDFIEKGAILFFFFCLALMLGILSGKFYSSYGSIAISKASDRIATDNCISFFSCKARWSDILKTSIPIAILLISFHELTR
jgi:hypothetical protein